MKCPFALPALVLSSLCAAPGCRTSGGGAKTSGPQSVFDAEGRKLPDSEADSTAVAWRPLDKARDKITGIGVLNAPLLLSALDVCTASLLDTGVAAGPAYVLSNAHCTFFEHWGFDPLKVDEHRVDLPTSYSVTFNHYVGVPEEERRVFTLKRLTYLTENGTDVSILEVDKTLGEMIAAGVRPLKLSAVRPVAGRGVRLIGVPLAFVSAEKMSLLVSSCKVDGNVSLLNGDYRAPSSVIHHCSSVPGFSGGPLLADDTGEVVLLNSHGAADDSGDADCTYATRPCELREDGTKVVVTERNYAQYVDGIAGCFGESGRFDLKRIECRLPK